MIPPELIAEIGRLRDRPDLTKGLSASIGKLFIQTEAYNLSELKEPKNPLVLGNRRREIRRSVYKISIGQHFQTESLDQLLKHFGPPKHWRH